MFYASKFFLMCFYIIYSFLAFIPEYSYPYMKMYLLVCWWGQNVTQGLFNVESPNMWAV